MDRTLGKPGHGLSSGNEFIVQCRWLVMLVVWIDRSDIGEYLGLTVETVSRIFTALQKKDLIAVNNRETEIKDIKGLRALIGSKAA